MNNYKLFNILLLSLFAGNVSASTDKDRYTNVFNNVVSALDKDINSFYKSNTLPFSLKFKDGNGVMSCSAKDRTINVYSSMFNTVLTDDEIASIFAHELGHVNTSNCIPLSKSIYTEQLTAEEKQVLLRNEEIKADLYGIELLKYTQYDNSASLSAMTNMYDTYGKYLGETIRKSLMIRINIITTKLKGE